MAILDIQTVFTGKSGFTPSLITIDTDDSYTTVTASGYLNGQQRLGHDFNKKQMALIYTTDGIALTEVTKSGDTVTLQPAIDPGSVDLPVIVNHIAAFTDTDGTIGDDPATAINGGNIQAGLSGTAGYLASFPGTASKGSLRVTAVDNTGDTLVTISNAQHGQASTYSIPDGGQSTANFIISESTGTQAIASGNLQLDTGNIIAGSDANAGYFESHPGTTNSGTLRLAAVDSSTDSAVTISNADHGQATVLSIPDGGQATANFIISESTGTQSIASGNLQVSTGNLVAGSDANAGIVESHPGTTNSGTLQLAAVDSSTDSAVTISNADFGQATVVSIPDPGAATANFLLDDGASNILSWQEFVGLEQILAQSAGTWTVTRIARGDYVLRHSVADDTAILGIDVTPMIRTASSKGFRLDSFDVIYSVAADALDAHSVTLDRIEYADNTAVSVNSIAITGTLATATQANPYVTNVSVDSPAFDNTADSKYVIEVTVDNSASSEYDFYGIMLRFSETVA